MNVRQLSILFTAVFALAACGDIKEFADAGGVDATALDAGVDPDAPPGTARLTVVKGGAGTGLITSAPAGVDCGATCTLDVPTGTLVTLTAAPGVGASFAGWGGACSGSITTCSITVNADVVVNADFAVTTHTVTVVTGGNGTGTVTSSVGGISCPGTCTATVPYGTSITLSAATAAPSMFLGWSGGTCTGTAACTFPVTANVTINASFALNFTLVVTRAGNGTGTVTSSPAGITCGPDCDETYAAGTMVTLTAAAAADATFTGWSGSGCSGTGTCTVTVNGATAVAATFTLRQYTLTAARTGLGAGTVTSSPAGINCGTDCSELYNHGQMVTLTATPTGTANAFGGWSGGGCTGTATTCTVTVTAATTVTADFDLAQYTLTVAKAGGGQGTVTSSPAGINCGGDCSEPYNHNTTVTLTAVAATAPLSAESTFTGWSGAGCMGTGTCTVTVTAATTVTANFVLEPNVVFVTTSAHTGNMGGIAGADAICQARAQAGSLPGTYRAWLSTSTASALSRLGTASGWVRPDGKPVANTPAEIVMGKLWHPIRINERNSDVGQSSVHTATGPDGLLPSNSTTCGDYTTALAADGIRAGDTSSIGGSFTTYGSSVCSNPQPIYCFGVDRAATVTPAPPATYRRAFTTAAVFTPGGGLAAADALCNSEASAASLPGTYRALLATSTASAASRFNTSGAPWGRPDGVLLTPTAAALFQQTLWDSAPIANASLSAYYSGFGVWGGATGINAVGTTALTCSNWSSTAGSTGGAGITGPTPVGEIFNRYNNIPCSAAYVRLTCLQQ